VAKPMRRKGSGQGLEGAGADVEHDADVEHRAILCPSECVLGPVGPTTECDFFFDGESARIPVFK